MYSVLDLKLIAISVISFGSYIFGVLPNVLAIGANVRNSTLFSTILCFGGGVLFATSFTHILPEIRHVLHSNAELVFCAGYFLMYLIDVIIFTVNNRDLSEVKPIMNVERENYGATNQETIENDLIVEPDTKTLTHLNCKNLSLLIAFSLHSLLEGLVIGVETTESGVLLLLGAVCCHKLLVAFCLGAELSSDGQPLYAVLPALSVFVVGSSVGIAVGTALDPAETPVLANIVPILQGLAGGALLNIVVTEILPRERSKNLPRYSAIFQFIAFSLGFALMFGFSSIL